MSGLVSILVGNAKEMREGFALAQKNSVKWTRSALARGGRKVVARFKREDLSGAPGIDGGQFKKGRHVFSFVNFGSRDDVTVGISRILRTHEEGATIVARNAPALYLSEKTGTRGEGHVFAVTRSVTIPPRTGFRLLVREMAPEIADKVAATNVRAIEDAMRVSLRKTIGGF